MICIETQYLNLNRILLLVIGIWPFQQSRLTQLQFTILFIILLTSIIFQLTTFMTATEYTINFIIKILSSTSILIVYVIKYYMFYINIEFVKKFLVELQQVCDNLKDKNEFAIIKKCGYIAKCYTVGLTIFGTCGMVILIIVEFYIMYENVIIINVTAQDRWPFEMEYFVDKENYFFLFVLHMNVAMCIGAVVILGTGTLFIAFFTFFCGMFQISCYRIKCAVKNNILQNATLKNKILKSKELICAINIHRQAVNLCKNFLVAFETMYFFLAQIFVLSLCVNFLQISQIIFAYKSLMEALISYLIVIINILYLFIGNVFVQNITDCNNDVFNTVYNVEWYETPLQVQKTVLFLLLKGAKNLTMCVGGLFYPSLECFASLIKASVSYFTVILSTQR